VLTVIDGHSRNFGGASDIELGRQERELNKPDKEVIAASGQRRCGLPLAAMIFLGKDRTSRPL
jgi:hypothetical protein